MAKRRDNPNKRILREAGKFQPFDYGFMLGVEREMVASMLKFFESDLPACVGAEHKALWLRIALRLLDIMTDKASYYYFTGSPMTKDHRLHLRSRVNTRNCARFFPYASGVDKEAVDASDALKASLYERKVWHLYNAIRETYMQTWWD